MSTEEQGIDDRQDAESPRFPVASTAAIMTAVAASVAYIVYQLGINTVNVEFNQMNDADRCLHAVIDNKGAREAHGNDGVLLIFNRDAAITFATYLTPQAIAQCEQASGQKRSAAWDQILTPRP